MADNNREKYIDRPKFPQIYGYRLDSTPDEIKVGFTTQENVRDRIKEQLATSNQGYTLTVCESAIRDDGSTFSDHDVHKILQERGFIRVPRKDQFQGGLRKAKPPEIFLNCSDEDVKAAIQTVKTGKNITARRLNTYEPRKEQRNIIDDTKVYFLKEHTNNPAKTAEFLWNAKMRFGKTFAALRMAKEMELKKILIITFRVEVKDSWRSEVYGHQDFVGWQFVDLKDKASVSNIDYNKTIVAFGSFQDLTGKNELGGIKVKNEWVHATNWDLVIIDEYHYGAWRKKSKELFDDGDGYDLLDDNILPITSDYKLYLSGTPFRQINNGEFLEDQIRSWTYNDEQQAKLDWNDKDGDNPYAAMPQIILMTYQLPDACTRIALNSENNEFNLNEFFRAECEKTKAGKEDYSTAKFVHENEVQRWLDIIRGKADISSETQKAMGATKPVLPYYDSSLVQVLNHTLWYMYSVASCYAMKNLLEKPANAFYHDYTVIVAAGNQAGSGERALEPVKLAQADPLHSKSITITCGKLTTGVTVRPWTGIFMLSSISTPEAYFQSAFRVQSPWTVSGDAISGEYILKDKCYIFDFAPNRALRQLSEYACGLNPDITKSAEDKVDEFINFLPVLAFDGSGMYPINAAEILDYVASGTTATLLARKWDSALLVNVTNDVLEAIINDPEAKEAIMNIEGFRNMNSDVFEVIVNRSKEIKERKQSPEDKAGTEKREITREEKELKSQRKQIQENLRKFATRIPLFMYLTDDRENCLQDVITKVEPALFKKVTGIKVSDFEKLVELNVFNASAMNEAVAAFRRYEESSLVYAGIDKHYGERVGLWNISVKQDELHSM